jgi:hypothetical protein
MTQRKLKSSCCSVAKGPKFRPQTQKGQQKFCGEGNIWGQNFARFIIKVPQREPIFIFVLY